jgi:hypothetical protein
LFGLEGNGFVKYLLDFVAMDSIGEHFENSDFNGCQSANKPLIGAALYECVVVSNDQFKLLLHHF